MMPVFFYNFIIFNDFVILLKINIIFAKFMRRGARYMKKTRKSIDN